MMTKLKELWKNQWAKNLVFFGLLSIAFFTDFPRWVQVQFTRFTLDQPSEIANKATEQSSVYRYDLRMENVDGTSFNLTDFEGDVVFINFWASWCVPCLAEFPSLEKLQQKLPEMKFAVINLEDRASFQAYMEDAKLNLPFYRQLTPLPTELNPSAIPTSILLDRTGKVLYRYYGAANWNDDKVVEQLRALLG